MFRVQGLALRAWISDLDFRVLQLAVGCSGFRA